MGIVLGSKTCQHLATVAEALKQVRVNMLDRYSEVYIECKECGTSASLEYDEEEVT